MQYCWENAQPLGNEARVLQGLESMPPLVWECPTKLFTIIVWRRTR